MVFLCQMLLKVFLPRIILNSWRSISSCKIGDIFISLIISEKRKVCLKGFFYK